ncbi:restriction endonuclease subunit S [Leifsonia sp. NPDC058292]|uniref:restriction endonuclease subunit S n=1 Tax=Leifsonia sp. NPDC058292 TaxID=3346428 RepID=UPI0036D8657A
MRDEWGRTTLGELVTLQNGFPFKPGQLGQEGLPVVRIKQLLDARAPMDRSTATVPASMRISDGDVIFSWSATLSAQAWSRGPALLNQHLFSVSPRTPEVDKRFLVPLLQYMIPSLPMHGTTMKHVTKRDLNSQVVALPSLAEQRRIVDLIGSVDGALEEAVSLQHSARKTLTELGAEAVARSRRGAWPSVTLAEAVGADGLIQTGPFGSQLHKADYVTAGTAVVMPTNMSDGRIVSEGIARIDEARAARLSRHRLQPGDIVWSRRGDVTRFATVSDDDDGMLCGTGCLLVRPGDPSITSWLEVWLSTPVVSAWLTDHAVGATMANLNTRILGGVPVVLPPDEDRPEFVGMLSALREQFEAAKNFANALQALRARMLTVLISGAHEIPSSYDRFLGSNGR